MERLAMPLSMSPQDSQSSFQINDPDGQVMAIVIRASHHGNGIDFFTPPEFSQQLAYMCRPSGHVIDPHVHNAVSREVQFTHEVLFVRRGRLRVDLYSNDRTFLRHLILTTGDVILLASGGHGFEMLEETELIEVKQGPYAGDRDKTRFSPRQPDQST